MQKRILMTSLLLLLHLLAVVPASARAFRSQLHVSHAIQRRGSKAGRPRRKMSPTVQSRKSLVPVPVETLLAFHFRTRLLLILLLETLAVVLLPASAQTIPSIRLAGWRFLLTRTLLKLPTQ